MRVTDSEIKLAVGISVFQIFREKILIYLSACVRVNEFLLRNFHLTFCFSLTWKTLQLLIKELYLNVLFKVSCPLNFVPQCLHIACLLICNSLYLNVLQLSTDQYSYDEGYINPPRSTEDWRYNSVDL